MDVLATLLLGHLIADFPLQANWIYRAKRGHWAGLPLHSAVHCAVAAMLLDDPLKHLPLLISLALAHFTIDWFKLRVRFKPEFVGFILDQIAHVLALLLLTALRSEMTVALQPAFLYPALAYSLVPALLMFLEVLAIGLKQSSAHPSGGWKDECARFASLSQWAGAPLVVGVLAVRFFGS